MTVTNLREEKIDAAICAAGALISALLEQGPLTPAQAEVIITAAVAKAVPNFALFEIRERAKVIAADVNKQGSANIRIKQRKKVKTDDENIPNEE